MTGNIRAATRSLMSTARSCSFLRSPPLSSSSPRFRLPLSPPRNFGQLGCAESLLPFGNAAAIPRLTSHLSLDVRAFTELSNGTFCRSCQDR